MVVRLATRKRALARSMARQCMLEGVNNEQELEAKLQEKLEPYGLDPTIIIAMIYYAIKLWLWWRDRKINDPGLVPISGEPEE